MTSVASLSALERDALTELVNIGVSRAAGSLRTMVGRQVLLSVPSIEVVGQQDAASLIAERETGDLVAVRQDFTGAFSGRALLIFPRDNSIELVRAVIGETVSLQEAEAMEHEALAETGNIILNGCLGTMANMLRQSLSTSLPSVFHARGVELFRPMEDARPDSLVLFLYINFAVQGRDIRGYIAMLLDMASLSVLRGLIGEFIDSVMRDDAETA